MRRGCLGAGAHFWNKGSLLLSPKAQRPWSP